MQCLYIFSTDRYSLLYLTSSVSLIWPKALNFSTSLCLLEEKMAVYCMKVEEADIFGNLGGLRKILPTYIHGLLTRSLNKRAPRMSLFLIKNWPSETYSTWFWYGTLPSTFWGSFLRFGWLAFFGVSLECLEGIWGLYSGILSPICEFFKGCHKNQIQTVYDKGSS